MTRNPVRTAAFFGPMSGYPGMPAVGCDVPVTLGFLIMPIIPMPFRTNPNMVCVGAGRAMHLVFMWSVLYIIMLCADT
jgi:hypothetical protein